jgi:cytoskeleton protein RodZ
MATTKTTATKITPKSTAAANAAIGAQRASAATLPVAEPVLPLHHVGHTLKEAREARGLTVENLANELMIRRYYLQAIEDGNYKTLPDRVYAMGFVRNYSDYLGLDGNALTEQFRREAYSGRPQNAKVELSFLEPISHNIVPGKTALFAGVVLAGIALTAGLFMIKSTSNPTDDTALKALPSATSAPTPIPQAANNFDSQAAITTTNNNSPVNNETVDMTTTTAAVATDNTTPATPAALPTTPVTSTSLAPVTNSDTTATSVTTADNSLVSSAPAPTVAQASLTIKQTSWVEVRNNQGQTLLSKIAKAGDVLALPNQSGLVLTVGNAGGVVLTVDNKALATLGPVGEVRRNIKLDSLLQPATPKAATTVVAPAMPAPTSLPAPSTLQE